MTFLEIQQRVYEDTGFGSSPSDAAVVTRVKNWINEGHRGILRDPAMSDLRQASYQFSSVATQTSYPIPQAFERVDAIVQQTNDRRLRLMSRSMYRTIDPAERSSGNPDYYVMEGWSVLYRKPDQTAGTGIWAVSSASGDTTQTVTIQGVRLSGDTGARATATLNGTTRVQVANSGDTISDYIDVFYFNVSAVGAGKISLYDAASNGNELAHITIGFKNVQYDLIRLWPTPSAALPYVVDGQRKLFDLSADTDIPLFPLDFHDVLVNYAEMREYTRTGDKRLQIAADAYKVGAASMRKMVQFPPDYRPVAGTIDQTVRRNNLGGYYAADYSWP